MKSVRGALLLIFGISLTALYTNCGQGFQSNADLLNASSLTVDQVYLGKNVAPVTVGTCGYVNAPCVTVTVCVPGTSTCKTIPNVLVDTGSTGLRIFKQVLGVSLTNLKDSTGKPYAECQGYIGGSSDWGPIARADIVLANEKASNVPMQIIDSTFMTPPSSCANLDASPEETGFNGILGVGLFSEDCGSACVNQASLGIYYSCTAASCTGSSMPLANQTTNPVARMPVDNNGVILKFPPAAAMGAPSLTGTLTLGIGTQANNVPTGLTALPADAYGNFRTEFDGRTITTAFIDSGSNALFFDQPTSAITMCSETGNAPGFYCPSAARTLTATMKGASGGASKQVSFEIVSAEQMLANGSTNMVFPDLAGHMDGTFDWGFPFFIGRTVVTAIEGKSTYMGNGPYWAF